MRETCFLSLGDNSFTIAGISFGRGSGLKLLSQRRQNRIFSPLQNPAMRCYFCVKINATLEPDVFSKRKSFCLHDTTCYRNVSTHIWGTGLNQGSHEHWTSCQFYARSNSSPSIQKHVPILHFYCCTIAFPADAIRTPWQSWDNVNIVLWDNCPHYMPMYIVYSKQAIFTVHRYILPNCNKMLWISAHVAQLKLRSYIL